jgi:tetratricopeptide (TPR) repeat protein
MVHMASHEYQRNGLYAKGVEVNDLADDNLIRYEAAAKNLSLTKHSPHYFAVQTYCALTGGMYKTAIKSALRCRRSVSPAHDNNYDQYLYMIPSLTMARLGKWQEILNDSVAPDKQWTYAMVLHHFAKGLAFVNTGHPDSASWHLAQLRIYQKDPILDRRRVPFNSPKQMAGVAEQILAGAVLFANSKFDEAIGSLKRAIEIEDQLIYTEPSDWPIPARQFLGAFLLKMGKAAAAERVYREDLAINPNNGWSLLGLSQSLGAQNKKKEMTLYKTKYLESFASADEIPTGSVFMK